MRRLKPLSVLSFAKFAPLAARRSISLKRRRSSSNRRKLWLKWGEPAGNHVGVYKVSELCVLGQKFLREGGLARTVRPGDEDAARRSF
jgi:hypothetical protein